MKVLPFILVLSAVVVGWALLGTTYDLGKLQGRLDAQIDTRNPEHLQEAIKAMEIGRRLDLVKAIVDDVYYERGGPWHGAQLVIYSHIPFALFHRKCGGLAFFVDHRPVVGGPAPRADQVAMMDGRRPISGELARCSTCDRIVQFSYRGDDGLCFEGECP